MGDQRRNERISVSITRALLPWCLLFAVVKPLLSLRWPPFEWSGGWIRWLWIATDDIAFVLPFILFAAGVALKKQMGYSRRTIRAAVTVGIVMSATSYFLAAWGAPAIQHRALARVGSETADARRFGARTPIGILRNLRFAEANPSRELSLRVSDPRQFPPNVLRWELHFPVAMAVFGLTNVFLGVLAAELTVDLKRGRRRNARLAIGLFGGAAFFALHLLASPMEPFLRTGALRSGVGAAWAPLLLPFGECLLLVHLLRIRRYG